jgi:peptide/nickel transport system permease protein
MRARSRRRSPPSGVRSIVSAGPWALALRRLRRDRVAIAFAALLAAILLALLAAPLYASEIAGTGPDENHLTDQVVIDGESTDVVSEDGVPIGPTWHGSYFLGADENGRDLMVRLLLSRLRPLLPSML